jgi:hypothetical protein
MQEGFNEVRLDQAIQNYHIMLQTDPSLVSPHKKNVMALCMDEIMRLRPGKAVIALDPNSPHMWHGPWKELPPDYAIMDPHWFP